MTAQKGIKNSRGTRCLDDPFRGVNLHDDTILAQLLLDEDYLLRALDNEVSSRVQRTFRHARELGIRAPGEHALVAPQHDGQSPDVHVGAANHSPPTSVLNGDEYGRAVRRVAQPAFVRSNALVNRVRVSSVRKADDDVGVLEPKARINVRRDFVVGLEDVLDVYIDEVVE